MKFVQPVSEEKLMELEQEFAREKARFARASEEVIHAIRTDLSLFNWIREYPLQTAAICAAAGYLLVQPGLRPGAPLSKSRKAGRQGEFDFSSTSYDSGPRDSDIGSGD